VCSAGPPLPPRHYQQQQSLGGASTDSLSSISDVHVGQLVSEGFDEHSALRALHLAKDDVQLARDILVEFASRRTGQQ